MTRVSEPTRVTRPSNTRLLSNPSHHHKRLLIYCHCCYVLILPLLIVVLVIYSLLKMAAEKVACRNRKWSESCRLYASVATVIFNLNGLAWQTDFRCAHYMSDGQTIDIYNSRQMMKNHGKKSAFLHEMLNIGPTLVWHWYNIILRNRVERISVSYTHLTLPTILRV